MAAFSNVTRNDVLIMTSRFNTPLLIFMDLEMFICYQWLHDINSRHVTYHGRPGGGPMVVVSTAAFHARVRGSVPDLGGLKETKNVSSPSTCESQYCGEPPWPRGIVLGLRPPRISNPVSGGQCHLNHLTILRRFSWPSLAYMCTKVHKGFISFLSWQTNLKIGIIFLI